MACYSYTECNCALPMMKLPLTFLKSSPVTIKIFNLLCFQCDCQDKNQDIRLIRKNSRNLIGICLFKITFTCRGVLVLRIFQVNSQKLGVQTPQNFEFEQAIAMLKCENLPRTNSTKYETQNIVVKFQQNEHTSEVSQYCDTLDSNPSFDTMIFLPTARKGNVFIGVCTTQSASRLLAQCPSLLRLGPYVSY